jgi:ribosomal protein S18 acetylase RimI-like enzyme
VGRELLQAAISHAGELSGVSQVNLSVSEAAPEARRLYETVGFRVWGTEPHAICHGGQVVGENHMVLFLDRGRIEIRDRSPRDDGWVVSVLSSAWGSPFVVSRGRTHQADQLPALVAERDGEAVGVLTYRVASGELEVITVQALEPRAGVGSALLDSAVVRARESGCRRVWLVTTNDNAAAIAFYQSLGMRLVAVHRGALAESRRLKPEIPMVGSGGVPMEDELEFEFDLRESS